MNARVPDHAAGGLRVPGGHFEARYRAEGDPWRLEDRWYERRKRALTLASLTRPRYRRAFEPGCALGLLTEQLAGRCDELMAVDVSPTAVAATARRVGRHRNVSVQVMGVPDAWPPGRFDLTVLSEIGYYLTPAGIAALVDAAVTHLTADGELVAVHYRPDAEEHRTNGDDVHRRLRAAAGLRRVASHVEELFVLDVFRVAADLTTPPRAPGRPAGS